MAPSNPRAAAPPAAQPQDSNGTGAPAETEQPTVNRKKQKRRQKQAARLAAEQSSAESAAMPAPTHLRNGHGPPPGAKYERTPARFRGASNGMDYAPSDLDEQYELRGTEDQYYTEDDGHYLHDLPAVPTAKGKKKRKNKSRSESQHDYQPAYAQKSMPAQFRPPPPPPPPPPLNAAAIRSAHKVSKDRIWNTSTAEERERIKEFWLSLEETERRSLVKVEKEAVLKKMKEQQKHSCSCSVCGRKRTAIEEELEVLYDAYYEELEQYANHQHITLDDGTIMPPPRGYPPISRLPPSRVPHLIAGQRPSRARIHEIPDDEDDGDDEGYSDEEESEDYSDEELEEEPRGPAADFFNFGNSLTVQGGILTVADDLLRNDGKKFIEMMEQLAERRMQREEEAQYAAAGLRHPSMPGHNHGPPLEDDEYDDEEDEDYGSEDDEDYDEDEMETMTEEQRMEEGRRMFQIFAARMFEQRVLTAYREKVARERQEKLLEELADESRLDAEREAKRAKEAQKKKDKKKQQKQAKEEERAKREAEKAAEEAAVKVIEEQKLEEQRLKREEQRKKREAERRVQEEERQKKEAEKQRKLQEAREQQAETERKQREHKEKEKKRREEAKKKEKEEREVKERDAKERREREAAEKREREARAKTEKEGRDRAKKEEQASRQAVPPVTVPMTVPVPPLLRKQTSNVAVPIPPGLQPSTHASPHLQIATPAIPKAPSPSRPLQASSHQGSHQSSPKSAQVPSGSSATSPSSSNQNQPNASLPPLHIKPPLSAHYPAPVNAVPPIALPPGIRPYQHQGIAASPAMPANGFPGPYIPATHQRAPPGHDAPTYPHPPVGVPPYRGFAMSNGLPYPPGINGIRHMSQAGSPIEAQAPISIMTGASQPSIGPRAGKSQPHSRQTSASLERVSTDAGVPPSQPIARPAPIQRPSPNQAPEQDEHRTSRTDVDELSKQLGSSALLDGTDEPVGTKLQDPRGGATPVTSRPPQFIFNGTPMYPNPLNAIPKLDTFRGPPIGTWGAPAPYGGPNMSSQPSWTGPPGSTWSSANALSNFGGPSRHSSRPMMLRLLMCEACKQLSVNNRIANGFHSFETVWAVVQSLKTPADGPIYPKELLDICDTEGNAQNGGGTMVLQEEGSRVFVKYEPDKMPGSGRSAGAPGDIGSPIVGNAVPFGGHRGYQAPPGSGIPAPGF